MDDSVKGFIERQNIAHYIDQLKTETDPFQRDTLLKLLAEEEAKQIKAANWPDWLQAFVAIGDSFIASAWLDDKW
jgi:hypothetical protein